MTLKLSVDRFEGNRKEFAVLVGDDGRQVPVPRKWLPRGTKAGDLLTISLERDLEGTAELARRARKLRDDLAGTDPGGDIQL